MPAFMLHENATVLCLHSGQAKPAVTNQRVKVSGQKIVTQPGPYTISGCILPTKPAGHALPPSGRARRRGSKPAVRRYCSKIARPPAPRPARV